jgi:hypothetical protein
MKVSPISADFCLKKLSFPETNVVIIFYLTSCVLSKNGNVVRRNFWGNIFFKS